MSSAELQAEEIEVLDSIYEGDEAYKKLSATQYQYKYGDDGNSKSFLLDLTWPSEYPEVAPTFNMDVFYNRHLLPGVKASIAAALNGEAEQFLGMSMTYSLFEYAKENMEDLLKEQPEEIVVAVAEKVENLDLEEESSKPKEKKEQYTKSQKRRMWDKGGVLGEDRPRGWDWIEVIRHLSQTGGKDDES